MKFLELLPKDSDYYNTLLKKLSPPLVTLLSGEPEVQYVALRNINLIVQKRSMQDSHMFLKKNKKTSVLTCSDMLCVSVLQARDPEAGDQSVFRQVQRPDLRQAGETGHHDPLGLTGQHRPGDHRHTLLIP